MVGASWMLGALDALEQYGGFRASEAPVVLGTSVGALIATLVAAELPAGAMAAHLRGDPADVLADLDANDAMALRLARLPLPLGPGSLRLMLAARNRGAFVSGLLPRGVLSTEGIRALVERAAGSAWPLERDLRIVACDYASGERVEFGRERGPAATPGEAVAASCAIPGIYEPVAIGERPLRRRRRAFALQPRSARRRAAGHRDRAQPDVLGRLGGGGGLRERLAAARRRRSAALLAAEVRVLRARGTERARARAGVRRSRRDGAEPDGARSPRSRDRGRPRQHRARAAPFGAEATAKARPRVRVGFRSPTARSLS